MHKPLMISFLCAILLLTAGCGREERKEDKEKKEEAVINKFTEEYVKSFNSHDPKALASLWAEDAHYIDPETGNEVLGRNEIQEQFTAIFKEQTPHLDVKVEAITFPDENHAIETGTATVKQEDQEASMTAFKVFLEKRDGKWQITQMREVDITGAVEENAHLKQLSWLVGNWVDQDPDVDITFENKWERYQNFIIQRFVMKTEGQFQLEGRQIIGWDPIKKAIRSWVFDSNGGFGEGTWTKKDNKWIIETSHTLADGSKGSSINIITPVDDNNYTWESTGREVGGDILPDIAPVKVERVKEEKK